MKPYILFWMVFFLLAQNATAQLPQQTIICNYTESCMDYQITRTTQASTGEYLLNFTVTVNCDQPLNQITFELPKTAAATLLNGGSGLAGFYRLMADFSIILTPNQPSAEYDRIILTPKPHLDLKNGASYTFEYITTTEDYEALRGLTIQGWFSAGEITSYVSSDFFSACFQGRKMPECHIDLGSAVFGFAGVTNNSDGTTTLGFMVQNNTEADTEVITIEIPGAPEAITISNNQSSTIYNANHTYTTTYNQGILTFEARNTLGYAGGAIDYFEFTLPTELYNPDESFTLTLTAGDEFAATGLNTITCDDSPITPLPVELISFKGKATQSGIELEWETASEQNNDRFEVERSTDGQTFNQIGQVKGAGNSSIKQRYSFTDPVARAGVYYYRLRQVDYDDTDTRSKTIALQLKAIPGGGRFSVYPNPASGTTATAWVAGTGADVNGGTLQIVDMNGKVMYTAQIQAGAREIDLPLQTLRLPKGMYIVNLLHGTNRQTQKLIIQ